MVSGEVRAGGLVGAAGGGAAPEFGLFEGVHGGALTLPVEA